MNQPFEKLFSTFTSSFKSPFCHSKKQFEANLSKEKKIQVDPFGFLALAWKHMMNNGVVIPG